MTATEQLGPGGLLLWTALLARDPALRGEDNPWREVAWSACRTRDRCDRLEEVCHTVPPVVAMPGGTVQVHPAWSEVRHQARALQRLTAALRLPDAHGRRPQRRGARGVYRPRAPHVPRVPPPSAGGR